MRSEFREYYATHGQRRTIIKQVLQRIILCIYRFRFSRLALGSEAWHNAQHFVSRLSSATFQASIRSLFYSTTMKDHCGEAFYCLSNVCFNFPQRIYIGRNVFMNRNVNVVARDCIKIGNHVIIGPNTIINSGSHNYSERECLIRDQGHKTAPIIIGDDVFIGGNVFVLPGVTIGEGAVVGAGAVVTRNVEPYTVVAGVPARPIKRR